MKTEPVDPADYEHIPELVEIAEKIEGADDELETFCQMIIGDTEDESTEPAVNQEVKKEPVTEPVAEPQKSESPKASEEEGVVSVFKKDIIDMSGLPDEIQIVFVKAFEQVKHHFDLSRVKKEPEESVNPVLQPELATMKLEEELSAQNLHDAPRRQDFRSYRNHPDYEERRRRHDSWLPGPRDSTRSAGFMNGARFCLPRNDFVAEQRRREDRRAAAEERERRRRDDRRREDRRREDRRREERRRAERRGHNDDDRGRKRRGDRRDDESWRRGDAKRRRD